MFFGVFDADDAVFLLAVAQLEGVELEVVGKQAKGDLFFPDAVGQHPPLVLDGGVEEDSGVDGLSVFGRSDVYIEVQGVFGIGG